MRKAIAQVAMLLAVAAPLWAQQFSKFNRDRALDMLQQISNRDPVSAKAAGLGSQESGSGGKDIPIRMAGRGIARRRRIRFRVRDAG